MTSPTPPLYPLHFEPIFEYRTWGGRRLEDLLSTPLPEGPVGEAWVLSDRPAQQSRVADGPLAGTSLRQLIEHFPEPMMGRGYRPSRRFPLLLKYLDARDTLSVQVHPSDRHTEYLPPEEMGKSEAWVVLDAEPGSRIFAGLQPGVTEDTVRRSVAAGTLAGLLASFEPQRGDVVSIEAGTVHALGAGLLIFEPQQNSDLTFRLFDWNRVDGKTGQPRDLHIEAAISCIDFDRGPVQAVDPVSDISGSAPRERLIDNEILRMWRIRSSSPFAVGVDAHPSIMVCLDGRGGIHYAGGTYDVTRGDVVLLPAQVGRCQFEVAGPVTVLELHLP